MAENQVVTYQEVAAYQAENGVETYGAGSGGYTTGGIYVSWDTVGGFTGDGWKTNDQYSPVHNMTQEEIEKKISENGGTLNSVFEDWVKKFHYEVRYNWIFENVASNCRYEMS